MRPLNDNSNVINMQTWELMEFPILFFRERSSIRFKRGRRCMGAMS